MRPQLIELYQSYCDYIDKDEWHFTEHGYYKSNLALFMEWVRDGEISLLA